MSRGGVSARPDGPATRQPAADQDQGSANRQVTLLAAVAALGGFLFGYDTSIINGAVTAIGRHFAAGSGILGFTVSAALLGSAAGAFVAGPIADRTGRKPTMWAAAALFVISAVASGLAGSLLVLGIFRVVGGFGVGIASVVAPTYIAEVAPAAIRGRLGSLQQLAIVSGIFVALLVDYVLAREAGSSEDILAWGLPAWRWMFLSMVVPAAIYGLLSITIPESPRYLVAKGQLTAAQAVLRRTLGSRVDLGGKVEVIRESMRRETKPSLRDLRGPALGLLPVVWVGIGLSVFQQFVGINVIFYYSSVLWQAVGFDESNSLLITVITSVTNIVTTIIAISLIDRIGRRILLLIGSVGMSVTLGTLAVVFGTAPVVDGTPKLSSVAGPVALIAANLFVFAFGMSWGPAVWVLLGEKFPNRIRAAALSVAAAAQWLANWAISYSFPSLKNAGLGLAYGIYAVAAILSIFFVYKFVSETKGRELESMGTGVTS